jgi:hypothetical protein
MVLQVVLLVPIVVWLGLLVWVVFFAGDPDGIVP